jgi:hypothetical protein
MTAVIHIRPRRPPCELPGLTAADLLAIHVTGFYFCLECQRVCSVKNETRPGQEVECLVCGTHRVKWCPPVPCDPA